MVAALTATNGGLTWLERFAASMQYPTTTAAATRLGIKQGIPTVQFQRLQCDAGVALYVRVEYGHPQMVTDAGRALIKQ